MDRQRVAGVRGGKAAVTTTVIVCYSMHYDPVVLRELRFLNYAAERGLSQLAVLRDRRTRLVLITPEAVEEDVLDYYLREVAGFAADELLDVRDRLEMVRPRRAELAALDLMTLRDDHLVAYLRHLVGLSAEARLVNFAASPESDELSAALGVPAEQRPYPLTHLFGGKGGGKRVLRLAGVPTPPGPSDKLHSLDGVVAVCRELAAADEPPELVALKLDDPKWGGAVGTVVLDRAGVAVSGDVAGWVVANGQSWAGFEREVVQDGAIVECYFQDVTVSPSGQAFIDPAGDVHVISTQDQILEGDRYVGCVSPAASALVEPIRGHLAATGAVLSGHGVRGFFGIDFIARAGGALLATEINLRKVGHTHVTAHLGDVGAPAGSHFVYRRITEPALAAMTPARVVAGLRADGLLFDRATGTGVLLHMLGALARCGYLETTSVAPTRADALALDRRLRHGLGLVPAD